MKTREMIVEELLEYAAAAELEVGNLSDLSDEELNEIYDDLVGGEGEL